MKNIENKDNISEEKNSLDESTPGEKIEKFDKQMDNLKNKLKDIAAKEAKEEGNNPEKGLLKKIDDFFEKGKEGFEEIDSIEEKETIEKYDTIINRNIDIQVAIVYSSEIILAEIKNWEKEKNTVAKSLFRFADWILKTEK